MRVLTRIIFFVMMICVANAAVAAPVQTSSVTVDALKAAIASQDRQSFRAIDNPIDYIRVWIGELISSDAALDILHGCQAQSQAVDSMQFTNIKYACPSRSQKLACTTGNLLLMIYDDNHHTEVGLSEDRIFTGDCPKPPVPLMPAAFEPDVALAVTHAIIDGDFEKVRPLLTETVQVARAAKFATGSPEVQFQGRGFEAFVAQAKELSALLGRPQSVICDPIKSICKFAFDEKDRFLFAAMHTRDHKVEFIQFYYSLRALVLERMKQQGQ